MTEKTQAKIYRISHTDGRPDELFEYEAASECDHNFVPLGDAPSFPYGEHSMTKGGCTLCGEVYVEEKDKKGKRVAFFKRLQP